MGKSSLCAVSNRQTIVTLCEYVRRQRLAGARDMLISTTQSMDEIAEQYGFSSSTYISTVFKQTLGMMPSSFRKSGRKAQKDRTGI